MLCPNCKAVLVKKAASAQGVWHCDSCGSVFFIVVITEPKEDANNT